MDREEKMKLFDEIRASADRTAMNARSMPMIPFTADSQKAENVPTLDQAAQLRNERALQSAGLTSDGLIDGTRVLKQVIGEKEVAKAQITLLKYKQGKANLEARIVENEQWYKLRHWDCMNAKTDDEVEPASAWLFNCIANKHADAMDNFPAPNILPREKDDKGEAEMLTSVVPVILEQCDFEQVYSDVQYYKLKMGTGVYGVFWDSTRLNGLGDVAVRKVDLINLFWEPGITDIQCSRNIFHVELADNDILLASYPQLSGKLGSSVIDTKKYIYDDTVDTSEKSLVVDWYYKKNVNGRTVLHYCKYCNGVVLYASENNEDTCERGWYDHGMYPFIFDVLFPFEGTPAGFGYIDVGKNPQKFIDIGDRAIQKNLIANSTPRYFINSNGDVNESEFADWTTPLVHVTGALGQDSVIPIQVKSLGGVYLNVLNGKIDELKETTGNRDISTGGTTSGVTAASAIAAMQEAGSKLSRDTNKASYRAFKKLCYMIVELIRQFYDISRCFRILGNDGTERYVRSSNEAIKPQHQGNDFGSDRGYRLPVFDIEITAQKQSPYSKMAQNELALQFYKAGFFNPQMADQALACLDIMDFDRKHFIMQKIAENGTMYQQVMQLKQTVMMMASELDRLKGTNMAGQMAMSMQGGSPVPVSGVGSAENSQALGGGEKESSTVKKARQRTADATSPQ